MNNENISIGKIKKDKVLNALVNLKDITVDNIENDIVITGYVEKR